jgi:hypothetical protein
MFGQHNQQECELQLSYSRGSLLKSCYVGRANPVGPAMELLLLFAAFKLLCGRKLCSAPLRTLAWLESMCEPTTLHCCVVCLVCHCGATAVTFRMSLRVEEPLITQQMGA